MSSAAAIGVDGARRVGSAPARASRSTIGRASDKASGERRAALERPQRDWTPCAARVEDTETSP